MKTTNKTIENNIGIRFLFLSQVFDIEAIYINICVCVCVI